MAHFSRLLRRFAGDESGVFAVIFGLMAIVLVALGGAVVDYVALEQTRSRAQTALDAAALALQPRIFEPGFNAGDAEILRGLAEDIMLERIGDTRVTASIPTDGVVTNIVDGSLYFRANFSMPTTFVSLVGVHTLGAQVQSEATRKKLKLEVVMVLDNSGSMDKENRMPRLVDAAKCATYILMYDGVVDAAGNVNTCVPAPGAELVPDVRIGIVPFTMFVNVGKGNANKPWMDQTGASSIHYDNFDNDDDEGRGPREGWPNTYVFPTRQTLFAATKQDWLGCVEARPHIKTGSRSTEYLDTDDTLPTGADTLFVPMFAPDVSSGDGANNYISNDTNPAICDRPGSTSICEYTQERTKNRRGEWNTPTVTRTTPKGPEDFVSNALYPNAFYGKRPDSCTCRNGVVYENWVGEATTRKGQCAGEGYVPTGITPREAQERVCKYWGPVPSSSDVTKGPNADCIQTPILPLTADPAKVISTISAMRAVGGTNVHQGAVWGFRTLSPTLPFDEGGEYDEAISKVLIIMTDGENTAYQAKNDNNATYNSAYGYPYNSLNNTRGSTSGGNIHRLGSATASNAELVRQMNERTEQTCANAKHGDQITIYTIGLATDKVEQSTKERVREMLTNCSTQPGRARFPTQSSELKSVFEDIANDLAALRLAL